MKNIFKEGFSRLKKTFQPNKESYDYILKFLDCSEEPFSDDYFYNNVVFDKAVLFTASVGFHHKKGSIVEATYPHEEQLLQDSFLKLLSDEAPQKTLTKLFESLVNYCLPDGVHLVDEDISMFILQNFNVPLYGVSCYKQLSTSSKTIDSENVRNCVQKAIVVISTQPFFSLIYGKLFGATHVYFEQVTMMDKKILQDLYENLQEASFSNVNLSEINFAFQVTAMLDFLKERVFPLLKLILLEKRIVVYSQKSGKICNFILTLLSLIPGSFKVTNMKPGQSMHIYEVTL